MTRDSTLHDFYRLEANRLATFDDHDLPGYICKELAAKTGLFSLRYKDMMQCFECLKVFTCFDENTHDLIKAHAEYSPRCRFAKGISNTGHYKHAGNVEFGTFDRGAGSRELAAARRLCYSQQPPIIPSALGQLHASLGFRPHQTPVYEKLKLLSIRESTFRYWPSPVSMENLALAGFFYLEHYDMTACFQCGLCLAGWNGDPFRRHYEMNPLCRYVRCFLTERETTEPKESENVCKVCLTNERNIVILPCKHFCVCQTCSVMVDNCPVCRLAIAGVMRIYVS